MTGKSTPNERSISPALADRSQLQRWATLLKTGAGDILVPADDAGASYRSRTIRALRAVSNVRKGLTIDAPAKTASEPTMVPAPAAVGSPVAAGVWETYARFVAGDSDAAAWLTRAINGLSPTALIAGISDNPEPWWQNEMVILHALHSFALICRDPAMLEKTLRCTQFHLEEIQPDHATNEPWSIHAYASHPDGVITAETLLHAAYMHHGGKLSDTSRLIAHDAAAALEAYLAP